MERETGEIHDCSKCPHNQFGSGKNGSGKACKNIHRCYILQEGNPVPIILALPPTSLKYIRDYIGKRILLKGLRCYDAVTKITLKKEKSADGITYSRAAFAFVSKLTDEQRAETKAMVEMIKAQADNIPDIDEADYNTGAAVDAADFQSVELCIRDRSSTDNGKINYTCPVQATDTKKTERCVCIIPKN